MRFAGPSLTLNDLIGSSRALLVVISAALVQVAIGGHVDRVDRILVLEGLGLEVARGHLLLHVASTLDGVEHVVELARVDVVFLMLLLHLLNHLIDAWLLKVITPELKDSLILLLGCLASEVLSCLSWIVTFKGVSEEIESLEHHDVA